MANVEHNTLSSAAGLRRKAAPLAPVPALYVAFHCDKPLEPPSRHFLGDADAVCVGRGVQRSSARVAEGPNRQLLLSVADGWMSSRHAVLRRSGERWILEDAGSRNGTFVNGQQIQRAVLKDGDLLELGHTLLSYREAVPRTSEDTADLDAASLQGPTPTFSPALAAEMGRIGTIARSNVSVVIQGETGSGKEVAARAMHVLSGRPGAFVAVNCGGIARTLVETELFGYRKGAFSGADEDRPGLMRTADKGTLFLDEIADLPAGAQAAVLRALQESEVHPVGATRPVKVDVRVLAATHFDLQQQVAEGEFRADLLARISGFTVRLPPLRNRREDLGLLIAEMIRRHGGGSATVSFSTEAANALFHHPWPLNVRELEKCIATALVLAGGEPIEPQHLPEWAHLPGAQVLLSETPVPNPDEETFPGPRPSTPRVVSVEDQRRREELIALLREHRGNISQIARAMGKARMQVQRWLKRFGLDPETYRG